MKTKTITWLFIIACALSVLATINTPTPVKTIDLGDETSKIVVYDLLAERIAPALNDPQSVEFPGLPEKLGHVTYLGDSTYTIVSYLRANNRFGGKVKQDFSALVYYSGKRFVVRRIDFLENN